MKYDWRSGNTTYFEDRRFEGTVIFDGRMKPHFAKVEITLAILLILAYRKPFGGPADPVKKLDPIQIVRWFERTWSRNSSSYNFNLERLQTLHKVREQL